MLILSYVPFIILVHTLWNTIWKCCNSKIIPLAVGSTKVFLNPIFQLDYLLSYLIISYELYGDETCIGLIYSVFKTIGTWRKLQGNGNEEVKIKDIVDRTIVQRMR